MNCRVWIAATFGRRANAGTNTTTIWVMPPNIISMSLRAALGATQNAEIKRWRPTVCTDTRSRSTTRASNPTEPGSATNAAELTIEAGGTLHSGVNTGQKGGLRNGRQHENRMV